MTIGLVFFAMLAIFLVVFSEELNKKFGKIWDYRLVRHIAYLATSSLVCILLLPFVKKVFLATATYYYWLDDWIVKQFGLGLFFDSIVKGMILLVLSIIIGQILALFYRFIYRKPFQHTMKLIWFVWVSLFAVISVYLPLMQH